MRTLTVLLGCCLLALGCGGDRAELVPVRGTVHYQGTPLKSGTIVLVPDPNRGGNGPIAIAKIESDGSYVLTSDNREGAVPGWHRVAFVSPLSPESKERALPSHYSDPDLSGQSCLVKEGQANRIDFHLH